MEVFSWLSKLRNIPLYTDLIKTKQMNKTNIYKNSTEQKKIKQAMGKTRSQSGDETNNS